MPTVPGCASINEVYGDDFGKRSVNPVQAFKRTQVYENKQNENKPSKPQNSQKPQNAQANYEPGADNEINTNKTPVNDIRSFCPNCKNCLDRNNQFQQQVIEQNIWPRPRWEPQYPSEYHSYDPYNRYWSSYPEFSMRENFGNPTDSGKNSIDKDFILNVILIVLIAVFIAQFFEMVFSMTEKVN